MESRSITRANAVNINIGDDVVRASMSRILSQSASIDDLEKVRTYLRSSDEGRAVTMSAMRGFTSELVLKKAVPVNPESAEGRLFYEMYSARADVMLDDLMKDCATAAERLVAQQVVDSWIRLKFVQGRYDAALDDVSSESVRFWDRMLSRASQRYLRALETLSRIRRYELQVVDRLDADGAQQRSVALRASS
jgi:hypothetical protein